MNNNTQNKILIFFFYLLFIVFFLNGKTIYVGPTKTYKSPCEAVSYINAGDTLEIDTGLYIDQACIWNKNDIVIKASSKYARLKAPSVITNQKAIFVIAGSNITIENIEFFDASVPDKNGAGIRQEGRNVIIRNCYFHDCEDGILGGNGNVIIENCEFFNCGYGDGYSHNMYISACDTFILRFCYTHSAKEGHTIKSRAFNNFILYNRIASESSTTSYEINLPNAGKSFIIGNIIQQGSSTHNSVIIDYGSEGLSSHDTMLYIVNNTIVNDRNSGTFISISNTSCKPKVYNNLFVGNGVICNRQIDSLGNVITNSPEFINKDNYDYHLTSFSPAVNKGINLEPVDGFSIIPVYQYVYDCKFEPRIIANNTIDAGAFEFSVSNVKTISNFKNSCSKNNEYYFVGFNPLYDVLGRKICNKNKINMNNFILGLVKK